MPKLPPSRALFEMEVPPEACPVSLVLAPLAEAQQPLCSLRRYTIVNGRFHALPAALA